MTFSQQQQATFLNLPHSGTSKDTGKCKQRPIRLYIEFVSTNKPISVQVRLIYTHILVQTLSLMNDCGNNTASIRHESALWTLVELVQSMYGATVVVLMLD